MRVQAVVASFLVATIASSVALADFFPFEEGIVREYEYTILGYGSGAFATYFSGTAVIGSDTTRVQHYAGGVDDGLRNFFSETPEGDKLVHAGARRFDTLVVWSPPIPFIDAPLSVGKKWKVSSTSSSGGLASDFHYEVAAFGDLTVPAGTFQAFTIRQTVVDDWEGSKKHRWYTCGDPSSTQPAQSVAYFSYADGVGLILYTFGGRTDRLLSIHTTAVQEQDWARTRLLSSPNPLERGGKIEFTILQSGPVRLDVFDVAGRRVGIVLDELRSQGRHELRWSGESSLGRSFASGVYFLRLETRSGVEVHKLAILE